MQSFAIMQSFKSLYIIDCKH